MAGGEGKSLPVAGFGSPGGADPREAQAKSAKRRWDMRAAVKRFAAIELDLENLTPEAFEAALIKHAGRKLTVGEMLALKKISAGFKNPAFLDLLTNDISGRQIEKVVEARASLKDLLTRSDAELDSLDEQLEGS